MATEVCECVTCCDGEHAGRCKRCAGWGEIDGKRCTYCDKDIGWPGVCPVCDGASAPEECDDGD